MRRHPLLWLALMAGALGVAVPAAADWTFKRSLYSHDPASGRRVTRYSDGETPYAVESNYRQSAYRHQRIRQGTWRGSEDNIHVVETWGDGENLRPYGEWLYPYRAGATPYGPWGNPQGPWTTPFASWVNPYGLGQLPHPPWPYWPGSYYPPAPYPPAPYPSPMPVPAPPGP